ncbi:hypothetical protein AB7714_19875 [Tardiphaga sp. 1201_B9_N1_1]|uniref:hypothetical protein n=1 Tax=unclassified Tardiphaga TaxID=2631404 RepID=UPI003F1EAD79
MKALLAILLVFAGVSGALADCAEINRQAVPKKLELQAATDLYKKSFFATVKDSARDAAPLDIIADGVAASSKMITAMDQMIDFLRLAQSGGCFGKETASWAAAIAKMEAQNDDMRKDRRAQLEMLTYMAKTEDARRKR